MLVAGSSAMIVVASKNDDGYGGIGDGNDSDSRSRGDDKGNSAA